MPLVLDVDDSIPVLPPPNRLSINDDVRLAANDGKGDHLADPGVEGLFLCVVLFGVERVETDVVVRQLGSDLQQKASKQTIRFVREDKERISKGPRKGGVEGRD